MIYSMVKKTKTTNKPQQNKTKKHNKKPSKADADNSF